MWDGEGVGVFLGDFILGGGVEFVEGEVLEDALGDAGHPSGSQVVSIGVDDDNGRQC